MRTAAHALILFLLVACGANTEEPIQTTGIELETQGGLVEFALSRDRETAVLDADPKVSDEFWSSRDAEIDAVLNHIANGAFDKPSQKLDAMVKIDQSLRHLFTVLELKRSHFISEDEFSKTKSGLGDRVNRVDTFNTAQVKAMLQDRGWFQDDLDGPNASFNAWLIAQHADLDPEFQRQALSMMEQVLGAPGVSMRDYAYLFDRVAGKDERPQRYGTQGKCVGPGKWEPFELEFPEEVDSLRAEAGMSPMDEYIALFKDLCL